MRLALVATLALVLTGCTVTLPHAETGKCYTVTHFGVIGWGYALADGIEGWRCKGMKEGDTPRPEKTL